MFLEFEKIDLLKDERVIKKYFVISLLCVPIGIIVGIACVVFTKGLVFMNTTRNAFPNFTMPFLSIAGIITVLLFEKFDDKVVSIKSGMKTVFDCGQGKVEKVPFNIIPIVCISTWLTNLCGGSCGREGVAVQIGVAISNNFSKWVDYKKSKEIFLIAGIGAGFAGMFQTPLAAIVFALEVLTIRRIKIFAILPTIVESLVSYYTAHFLGLECETYDIGLFNLFEINGDMKVTVLLIVKIVIASILFSAVGDSFSIASEKLKELYNKHIKNKYVGIFIGGIILSVLFICMHKGRYSGTGANLINACFDKNASSQIYNYDFVCKMILTMLTLSIGFQGGEVTPLFSIGATFGYILANVFGIDNSLLAGLGFISVFASATNTFFCPILIGVEIFGIYNLPFYIISVAIAYLVNFDKSIYHQNR